MSLTFDERREIADMVRKVVDAKVFEHTALHHTPSNREAMQKVNEEATNVILNFLDT